MPPVLVHVRLRQQHAQPASTFNLPAVAAHLAEGHTELGGALLLAQQTPVNLECMAAPGPIVKI